MSPQYEYFCEFCKKKFTVIKKFCEMSKVERCHCIRVAKRVQIPGGANFLLRGKGFHKNDYKEKKGEVK